MQTERKGSAESIHLKESSPEIFAFRKRQINRMIGGGSRALQADPI